MKANIKRWLVLLAGWFFILLGIAGLFLPILQGVLFLVVGLIILSSEYVWAHRLLQRLRRRFPAVSARAHAASERFHQWMNKIMHRRPQGNPRPLGP